MTTARVSYDRDLYEELSVAREAARDAYRAAQDEAQVYAITIANVVERAPGTRRIEDVLPEDAVARYREKRDEAERLRGVWFDASDAVRELTGRRKILR